MKLPSRLQLVVAVGAATTLAWFVLPSDVAADDPPAATDQAFTRSLQPLLAARCTKCHGEQAKPQGDVNLAELRREADLLAQPKLVESIIDALDSGYMPPEDEPPLADEARDKAVKHLTDLLHRGLAAAKHRPRAPLRRMNRFQYNNAVQDLFELKVVVYPLPERMMREHGGYFQPQNGKMPEQLRVGSRPLGKSQLIEPRLGGVTPFPQDLRAEHGFDTRGDHLSLSPLLLESLMKLSQSIVDSPDFHAKNCGVWPRLFAAPAAAEVDAEGISVIVRRRLKPFLTKAFRRPVEDGVLDRYTNHVAAQIESGAQFTDAMKSAAAAAIASPKFFYLYDGGSGAKADEGSSVDSQSKGLDDFELASRLSFFLWGSIPDQTLLDLAAEGGLRDDVVLAEQIDRMLRDRKLKRFCDSFPAQWLQLERIISSTPDRERVPQFYFLKYRASMHMMLEPLLVFETVLIENRPVTQLIDSDFSYRSNLLESWYREGKQGNAGSPVAVDFRRVPISDRRQGGVMTTAAVMTMTSGTHETKPITRGAWVASVILNDPPKPPPADVPPLPEEPGEAEKDLTLRQRFAAHRERADCKGCHERLDPLGFAFENYDLAGIWRDQYASGKPVDASGELFGKHKFDNVAGFKDALLAEKDRFTRGLAAHLLAYALGREVTVADSPSLDAIVRRTAADDYRFHTLIKQVILSDSFQHSSAGGR